jgi:hypothetical protein
MRTPVSSALLVVAAALLVPSGAQAANPVGFQLDLANGQHVECSIDGSALDCLNYGAEATTTCDAGGAVSAMVLKRTGAPKAKTFCVDEAFHAFPKLRAGKTWAKGAYKCRIRKDRTALRCSNRTAMYTIWAVETMA